MGGIGRDVWFILVVMPDGESIHSVAPIKFLPFLIYLYIFIVIPFYFLFYAVNSTRASAHTQLYVYSLSYCAIKVISNIGMACTGMLGITLQWLGCQLPAGAKMRVATRWHTSLVAIM